MLRSVTVLSTTIAAACEQGVLTALPVRRRLSYQRDETQGRSNTFQQRPRKQGGDRGQRSDGAGSHGNTQTPRVSAVGTPPSGGRDQPEMQQRLPRQIPRDDIWGADSDVPLSANAQQQQKQRKRGQVQKPLHAQGAAGPTPAQQSTQQPAQVEPCEEWTSPMADLNAMLRGLDVAAPERASPAAVASAATGSSVGAAEVAVTATGGASAEALAVAWATPGMQTLGAAIRRCALRNVRVPRSLLVRVQPVPFLNGLLAVEPDVADVRTGRCACAGFSPCGLDLD